jgi:4-amino-4-deoxy-L-arabinose transferase-like glycosyltransferase
LPPALVSIFFGAGFAILTCYALGALLLRRAPAPPEIALAIGAVAFSLVVFLLLLIHAGYWYVFLLVGVAATAGWRWTAAVDLPVPEPRPKGAVWIIALAIFGAYTLWYFVNALAPEILGDGITYHLGLPYEYVRRAGFPERITFYDMVPQGMEMLYTAAFAFGRHSAAKLVGFAFLLATVPMFFRVGRRLGLSDLASLVAAVFYFCAPVVGATGASSYTDAAGVFFTLAAFYLLLVWRDAGDSRYLAAAGAVAGFCYAIKTPGALTVAAAVLFVLAERGRKPAFLVAGCAALVMAPWLIRNLLLTGNPAAPLANGVFPNPYFHIATERYLVAGWRSLGPVRPAGLPWELAFGDRLQGTFGPLLFALPLGLLALRHRAGRWCWAAAAILLAPWFSNTGARFLMPAMALAGFTVGMVLPRPAAWAAIALQAALCWPQVIDLWETRYAFRLHEFPLAAALRIEPEPTYLKRHLDEYTVAKMIEEKTPPDAKILGLISVANAYLARDVRVTWQSAESDRLLDSLLRALESTDPLDEWTAAWPLQSLQALRFRLPAASRSECEIDEVRIYSGADRVYPSPQWQLRAWPNRWESPLVLDDNLATGWRTWEPVRAGMYLEIRFDHWQTISSAVVYSPSPAHGLSLEVYGQGARRRWHALGAAQARPHPPGDLRLDASLAIRRAGYRYVLAATGGGGSTPAGNALVGHESDWGMERVAEAGPYYLYRVK